MKEYEKSILKMDLALLYVAISVNFFQELKEFFLSDFSACLKNVCEWCFLHLAT